MVIMWGQSNDSNWSPGNGSSGKSPYRNVNDEIEKAKADVKKKEELDAINKEWADKKKQQEQGSSKSK